MKVLLIAGHGNGDPGAVKLGYREADLTRELTGLIKAHLSAYCQVDIANTALNWYRHVCVNGNKFNFKPYDYVLEIHFNASVNDTIGNGQTTGSEIYVTQNEKNVSVEQKILSGMYTLGFKNRGVKRKNYSLISYVKKQGVSAALLEVCFIDDKDDIFLYQSKKSEIARAIAEGIAEGYKLKKETKTMDYEKHWASNYIKKVMSVGIMNGYSDKSFKPDKPITRAEMATVICRLLDYQKEK